MSSCLWKSLYLLAFSSISCLFDEWSFILELLLCILTVHIVWQDVKLAAYLGLHTVLFFVSLPVPVLNLAPFLLPHLLVLLGVLQLFDLLLRELVFLIVELFRRDLFNEDQFVPSQHLTSAWTFACERVHWVDFPNALGPLGFPAKMAVEINHQTEVNEEKAYENQNCSNLIRALNYFQAVSCGIDERLQDWSNYRSIWNRIRTWICCLIVYFGSRYVFI